MKGILIMLIDGKNYARLCDAKDQQCAGTDSLVYLDGRWGQYRRNLEIAKRRLYACVGGSG